MFRSAFLLALWAGVGFATTSSETFGFKIKSGDETGFNFPTKELYKLFGPGTLPSICMNLTSENPVTVKVGGCNRFHTVGTFSTGTVRLNRSVIEVSMLYNTDDSCESDFQIKLVAQNESTRGSFNLFNCQCHIVQHPAFGPGRYDYVDTILCRPSVQTWNDRATELRFRLTNGETDRRTIRMDRAIHAALAYNQKTLCFAYHGDGFMKVTLSKCIGSLNITMLLNNDVRYGFANREREILNKMNNEKCNDHSDEWYVDIEPTDREVAYGAIDVFGCNRELDYGQEDDADLMYPVRFGDTGLMENTKHFYMVIKPFSEAIYSADLSSMIDTALSDPSGNTQIRVTVNSAAPISLSLTRCRTGDNLDRVSIAQEVTTGRFYLNSSELEPYGNLVMSPKCGIFEADEGLYLHVKSKTQAVNGSVTFYLDNSDSTDSNFKSLTHFNVPANSSALRSIYVGSMIDEALMNRTLVGFQLTTNNDLSIYLSRCKDSRRQLIAGSRKAGLFPMAPHVIRGIARVMRAKCSTHEGSLQGYGYLHIEGYYGAAKGSIQFVRIKYTDPKKYVPYVPFKKLPAEKIASVNKNEVIIDKKAFAKQSPEIDLEFYAYLVMETAFMDMAIKTERPVTLVLSKCQDSSPYNLTIDITGTSKVLTLDEVKHLYRLSRLPQCNNIGKFGLLVNFQDASYDGTVTFEVQNFRDFIENSGEYSTHGKVPHLVAMTLGNFNRSVSIRVSNTEDKPVLMYLSMCSPQHAPEVIWHDKMSMANIKLDPSRIQNLHKLAGNCNEEDKMTIFLSIRSERAHGSITIDKTDDNLCDGWTCGDGTMQYFKESISGWVIGQCKFDTSENKLRLYLDVFVQNHHIFYIFSEPRITLLFSLLPVHHPINFVY